MYLNSYFTAFIDFPGDQLPLVGFFRFDLVVLSVVIAICGAWSGLSSLTHAESPSIRNRFDSMLWKFAGGIGFGGSVWGMHFVGMLAFSLPCSVTYDFLTTATSIIPGVLASLTAMVVVGRTDFGLQTRLIIGSILMGAGIGTMHYMGMAALRLPAILLYDPWLVGLSIISAVVISYVALTVATYGRGISHPSKYRQIAASVILGCAVSMMHYVAMQASIFYPELNALNTTDSLPQDFLALFVGLGSLALAVGVAAASFAAQKNQTSRVLAVEILQRKVAEKAARTDQARLQAIFDTAAEAIVVIDNRGQIIQWSQSAQAMFGYAEDEAIGHNVAMLTDGILPEEHDNYIKRYQETRKARIIGTGREVTGRRKDGTTLPIELSVGEAVVGNDIFYMGILRDISERKKIQQDLARNQKSLKLQASELRRIMKLNEIERERAEEATKVKSEFLANMSHEIRTPMNGVVSMAEILALTPLDAEQGDMNKVIIESSKSLLAIINDILDFSKIEAGKIDIEKVSFSITALVEGVVQLLSPLAFDKGLEVIIFVDPETPDHLEGDPVRLRQVVTNLLSNAIKFTETGHVVVKVSPLDVSSDVADIQFTVTDTGIGLSQEQVSKLFVPFQQANSTITRRFGGTGLGLSISKKLINLMGGDIQVTSTLGEGATFSFDLSFPVKPEKRDIMKYDLAGIHILTVISNSVLGEAIGEYLTFLGAEFTQSGSYEETLTIAQQIDGFAQNLDVVILLDTPRHTYNSSALKTALNKQVGIDIPFICTELPKRGVAPEADKRASDTIELSRPYKREDLCRTVAKTVGRISDTKFGIDIRRSDDPPLELIYSAPTIEEAHNQGALILIAEDNPTNQTVIRILMEKLGFAAEIVSDGVEALKKFEEKSYGLLLTDCHMPEMDGYQLASQIRVREKMTDKRIPIIALTADALTGTAQRCLNAGMDDCLIKPVERKVINATICKWLPIVAELRSPLEQNRNNSVSDMKITQQSEAVLDLAYFRELVGGSDDMLASLLTEYVETTRPVIENLIETLQNGELDCARKAAHAGAGASKTAGAIQLAGICEAIEKAIVEKDKARAMAYVEAIGPAFTLVTDEVDTLKRSGIS